ncbi:antitoxin Xre-like helix-turn-helix domain-containing protein [Roseateles chitosanitabidus]|uniref:antitoxin Xre-like helix-turn-helix domain-containing protein n=1 Tax=Roseateles chitosanitabidus TaxID=65048 RepID=UPI001FE216FB|nr:antitoxin Xre-like helix-turn-helix domain-containing protein [Roseateles chitosanitabidus]
MSKTSPPPPSSRGLARARPTAQPPSAAGAALARFAESGQWRGEDFVAFHKSDPLERVSLVKQGLPPGIVETLAGRMGLSKERLLGALGLARATIERKAREGRMLSPDESSRIMGLIRLIGQVQTMVDESGDPSGFDAAAWTWSWLDGPVPALAGRRPAEYMDTAEGQLLVSGLVAQMQSGAYA